LLAGTISIAVFPLSGALAADQVIVRAPAPELGWYYYGGFGNGARFYIQHPPSGFGRAPLPDNRLTPVTSTARRLEEYGKIPQGPLLDWINLQTGSRDGCHALIFGAERRPQRSELQFDAAASATII
jgi:hypothetical protein